MYARRMAAALGMLGWLAFAATWAAAGTDTPVHQQSTGTEITDTARYIVSLRDGSGLAESARDIEAARAAVLSKDMPGRFSALLLRQAEVVRSLRPIGGPFAVIELPADDVGRAVQRLAADPDVEAVEPDRRRHAHAIPADPLFGSQWYLRGEELAAIDAESAWDISQGAADTVLAVLDSGVRFEHPDLKRVSEGGRLLAGHDFVSGEHGGSTFISANDGDGWDPDPSDPGDWVTAQESASGPLADCEVQNSSWHGLRVTGIVGATTDNGTGVAGTSWQGRILPVRVLGKCGGYDSDIIAAMRWAAGLSVSGAPPNPTPAHVINLSLGSESTCSRAYENAIAEVAASGTLVVVSAGNDNGPVDSPANCPGALAVAGVRHLGTKVGYSSFGPEVGVAAPAGNCGDTGSLCEFSLVTTTNTGLRQPSISTYASPSRPSIGTSFAAPIVAGIAALMHGVNSNLRPDEMAARLRAGARPFPVPDPGLQSCPAVHPETGQCNCTTTTCGAGIADAAAALREALRPIARVSQPVGISPGATITLDGRSSAAARGRSIVDWEWNGSDAASQAAITGGTTGDRTSVQVPAQGTIRVRLTVTDDEGRSDTSELAIDSGSATPSNGPQPGGGSSGGGGGGGSLPGVVLLLLAAVGLGRRSRQAAG